MRHVTKGFLLELLQLHPAPWYLDTANKREVHVKDFTGHTVFFETFEEFPDEGCAVQIEDCIRTATSLARFLVELSEDFKPQT